jgi:hypothetical protein
MDLTKVLQILGTNAKAATIAGVAIAATAGGGAVVATTVADSSPTTTTTQSSDATTQGTAGQDDANEAPDVKDTESPDAQESESPKAPKTVTPVDCGTTAWANHGAFVKSVAQATPSTDPSSTAAPNAHGMAVSAAAQSDCGKPTPGATGSADAAQGAAHANANATKHKNAAHGKSAAHRHH